MKLKYIALTLCIALCLALVPAFVIADNVAVPTGNWADYAAALPPATAAKKIRTL